MIVQLPATTTSEVILCFQFFQLHGIQTMQMQNLLYILKRLTTHSQTKRVYQI